MNRLRKLMITVIALCMVAVSSFAMAASEMTAVEKSWLDFQKAVSDQMVLDGKITREEADQKLAVLQKKLVDSPDDIVYKRISERSSRHKHKRGKDGFVIKFYADLTNRSVEDVKKACDETKLTIWKLAKKEGKLEELKASLIEKKTVRLDALIKEGKITQQKRDEKLKRLKEMLDKKR